MGVRVGIDTGGTFTDLVAVDEESGRWFVSKVPSNPRDPVAAVSAALERRRSTRPTSPSSSSGRRSGSTPC